MPVAQTVMSDAFVKAGFRPQETSADKLKRMMREAIMAGGGIADPSRDHFVAALAKADDAALLWELFASVRAAIIGRLFTETLIEMRADGALQNVGEARSSMLQGHRATVSPATHAEGEAENVLSQDHQRIASPSAPDAAAGAISSLPQSQRPVAPAAAPQKPSRLRYDASERVARLSILRTFRINGQALAEVTGAEARAWLKNHQRDGRFVALVSYQVPDEVKIGAIVPEDEADKLFKLATDAGNA